MQLYAVNFISQHVPLQKAILRARDCLCLTCVMILFLYYKLFAPNRKSCPIMRLFRH